MLEMSQIGVEITGNLDNIVEGFQMEIRGGPKEPGVSSTMSLRSFTIASSGIIRL